MKLLTEKQMHTRLDKYYKKYYGERDDDNWYVHPSDSDWLFVRNGRRIHLICDRLTGKVTEK